MISLINPIRVIVQKMGSGSSLQFAFQKNGLGLLECIDTIC